MFGSDLDLMEFSEPEIFNYSTLLLSEKRDALYVGAREAIFELSKKNVTVKNNKVTIYEEKVWDPGEEKGKKHLLHLNSDSKVQWTVAENHMMMCTLKGKSKEVRS